MTYKYNNVYLNETSTVVGKLEKEGILGEYYDLSYTDTYFGTKTFEKAEMKLVEESANIVLEKLGKKHTDVEVLIGGGLLNQLTNINFPAVNLKIPFMGIYNACATSALGLLIGANLIEAGQNKNCLVAVSSHNKAAERQFRYPVEYGGPKPNTATYTVTAGASAYLSRDKTGVKIESATLGTTIDLGQTDAYHMGAVMSPAAASTIHQHLTDLKRDVSYYDLILTGDLGTYGKEILKKYMKKVYKIELTNYNDCGTMLFNTKQSNTATLAGGSGPACGPLVIYTKIFKELKEKKLKKVLFVATGALHSPTSMNQKLNIPSIAHAISLEMIS